MIALVRTACAAGLALLAPWGVCAQHTVQLASPTTPLDRPLMAVLHLQPWNAAQRDYPLTCLQAQVRYGDFSVPPSQLRLAVDTVPDADHLRVTVFSPLLVNEPLVHLTLDLLCDLPQQHQWTLLADPAAPMPPPLPPVPAVPDNVWRDSAAGMVAPPPAGDDDPGLTSPPAPQPTPAAAHWARAAAAARDEAGLRGRSRLTLAPADRGDYPGIDRTPDADLLAGAVLTLLQQQVSRVSAELAAPLRALQARLDASEADNQRLQRLNDGLLARLEALEQRSPPSASAWNDTRPAAAHDAARGPTWAWTLHALAPWLAAAALAVLGWGWLRHRRLSADDSLAGIRRDLRPSNLERAAARSSRPVAAASAGPSAVTHRDEATEGIEDPAAEGAAGLAWPPALPDGVADEAWLDDAGASATLDDPIPPALRREAESWCGNGHQGPLTVLLEAQVGDGGPASAPVLLQLLELYRTQGPTPLTPHVADELTRWFNVRHPLATDLGDPDAGLASFPATRQAVDAAWSGPQAAAVMRRLLLRPTQIEELSPAAFRELLALYQQRRQRDPARPAPAAALDALSWPVPAV